MQLSAAYELVGPDTTRIVFGNSDDAIADPNYVGWLSPDEGISGLDSPEVREHSQDISGAHGGLHFDFLHGRRPVTASIVINPEQDIAAILAAEQKIKRATNAMSDDAVLSWTNTGYPRRMLRLRRQQPPRIDGRLPKVAHIAMISADYRLLSATENASAEVNSGVDVGVTNAGDERASPRFVLKGPYASPVKIRNLATGETIVMKSGYSLAAGQRLHVFLDGPYPIFVNENGDDRYDQIDFTATTWLSLQPGIQNVRAEPAGTGAGRFQAFWHDAWI